MMYELINLLLSSFHQKYYILITLICISSISPTNFDPLRLCISNVFLPFFLRFQKSINTKWNNVSWRSEQDYDPNALFDARLAHLYASIIATRGWKLLICEKEGRKRRRKNFHGTIYWFKLIFCSRM